MQHADSVIPAEAGIFSLPLVIPAEAGIFSLFCTFHILCYSPPLPIHSTDLSIPD